MRVVDKNEQRSGKKLFSVTLNMKQTNKEKNLFEPGEEPKGRTLSMKLWK